MPNCLSRFVPREGQHIQFGWQWQVESINRLPRNACVFHICSLSLISHGPVRRISFYASRDSRHGHAIYGVGLDSLLESVYAVRVKRKTCVIICTTHYATCDLRHANYGYAVPHACRVKSEYFILRALSHPNRENKIFVHVFFISCEHAYSACCASKVRIFHFKRIRDSRSGYAMRHLTPAGKIKKTRVFHFNATAYSACAKSGHTYGREIIFRLECRR